MFQWFQPCCQPKVAYFQFHGIINEEVTYRDKEGEPSETQSMKQCVKQVNVLNKPKGSQFVADFF